MKLLGQLETLVEREGFDCFGVAGTALGSDSADRLQTFLAENRHGTMDWMANDPARRSDPKTLWPEARSAIVVGLNYGPEADPMENLSKAGRGTISVYARNRDYHDLIKGALKRLVTDFGARARDRGHSPAFKVFVDTAPVMEKPLAALAGIGWQGKHTNLVSRDLGSWLFIGVIFTDLDLAADEPENDHCGSCRACLDICPTDAFPAPYQLDARRCISYLTIEHKGPINRTFRPLMGNRIFGCDDCLAVCPWNKFAQTSRTLKLIERQDLNSPSLVSLSQLDDQAFRRHFSGSPVKRIGRDRFMRNVLIAIGNSRREDLLPAARQHLSDQNPLVRGAAVWACSRLMDDASFADLANENLLEEEDQTVRQEWLLGQDIKS